MAFSELELQRIKREVGGFCKAKSPAHLRDQLRHDYRIEGQNVILYEVRPQWNDPTKFLELPYAKLTYVKKWNIWKLYWQRADLKFHRYDRSQRTRHTTFRISRSKSTQIRMPAFSDKK